jgi:hypothetical protein
MTRCRRARGRRGRQTDTRVTTGLPVSLGSLFGVLLLLALPANSWAYRPFVSTDAAVADPQEVEIELGYFTLEHDLGENTFTIPNLVLNDGVRRNFEVVGAGREYL